MVQFVEKQEHRDIQFKDNMASWMNVSEFKMSLCKNGLTVEP